MHYVRAYTTPLILSSSRDPSRTRLYADLQIGYIILRNPGLHEAKVRQMPKPPFILHRFLDFVPFRFRSCLPVSAISMSRSCLAQFVKVCSSRIHHTLCYSSSLWKLSSGLERIFRPSSRSPLGPLEMYILQALLLTRDLEVFHACAQSWTMPTVF